MKPQQLGLFLIALFVGGFTFGLVKSYFGAWGEGTTGFLLSGTIAFAVYWWLLRRYRAADPV